MQIFITLIPSGRKITAEVEGTDSVEALRRQIHELAAPMLGAAAAPEQQLLLFNEAVLKDGRALSDYDIRMESELRVSFRPRPIPVSLSVGGARFSTTLDTLCAIEGSRISAMFMPMRQGGTPVEMRTAAPGTEPEGVPYEYSYEGAKPLPKGSDGAWLMDRDGPSFRHVLNFLTARRPMYRNGQLVRRQPQKRAEPEPEPDGGDTHEEVVLPEALRTLLAEAQHFGLPELAALVKSQMAQMAVAVVVARLRTGAATDDRALECDGRSWAFDRVFGATAAQADVAHATIGSVGARLLEGLSSTVLAFGGRGTGKSHSLFGPDFGELYEDSAPGAGLCQRVLADVFASGGRSVVEICCLRIVGGEPLDLLAGVGLPRHVEGPRRFPPLGASLASPASLDAAVELLADAHARGRDRPGHTMVGLRVRHTRGGCDYSVEGRVQLLDLSSTGADAEGSDVRHLEAQLQIVAERTGFPDCRGSVLSSLLEDTLCGWSSCHAIIALDPRDAGGTLRSCRFGAWLQRLQSGCDVPNDFVAEPQNLTKVIRQQQREKKHSLKKELARRELRAAHSFGGLGCDPGEELAHVVAGLPETMAGLRALCALVPQAKAAFTEMKGIQTLSNYIDFARHGGNVAYNAVYTIAALCDDEDAAQEGLRCDVLARVLQLL